jgi:glycosyltransferase involved in cell wall biosynthesis
MPKQKILILVSSFRAGGAERVASVLLQYLDRTRQEIHVGVQSRGGAYWNDLPSDIGITVFRSPNTRSALLDVIRLFRRFKPDLVLVFGPYLTPTVALAKLFYRNPRTVYVVREMNTPSARRVLLPGHNRLDWLFKLAYRTFDLVICQSRDMLEDVAQYFSIAKERLFQIANPVAIEAIERLASAPPPPSPSGTAVRISCVTVGKLTPQKGYDLLLQAVAKLPRGVFHFHIVGEGERLSALQSQAEALGIADEVTFHGYQPNPFAFLRQADVFVFSSRHEGFPNALVEAMALGVPPVAFACPGGVTEIIAHLENGILVPPGNPEALAKALMDGDYSRLDRRVIAASIRDRYHVIAIVRQYESLFDRLIASKA